MSNGTKEKVDKSILIVDDEKVVRDFLSRFLTKYASRVEAVENAEQAVDAARRRAYDFVFLDIRLPGKNGLELLAELKTVIPEAKYIMMTGYAVEDMLSKAKEMGISASIRKPFDINQVLALVQGKSDESVKRLLKVLVVDDDRSVLDFFRRLLNNKEEYSVTTLENGTDAVELIAKEDFDLIFLDVVLQDYSGAQLYLKIIESKPNTDVILITGSTERIKIMEELNIKNCLTKPFEIDRIMAEIERVRHAKGK